MGSAAIQTFSLTKSFERRSPRRFLSLKGRGAPKRIVAVDHLNLTVPQSSLFGLLGPNGAGKTTTVRLLSTLILPDEGTSIVNGFDVVIHPNDVRGSIGVVTGGERGLYWRLTGRENLLFYARLYGIRDTIARPRIEDLLKLVELTDRADDLVEKYSRGMKQRLHLIRALVHDPVTLLMDEPTLGLDPNSALVVREFIKDKLQKELHKTILLTTHYMEEADRLCDRVAVIDNGRLIVEGQPSELKSSLKRIDVLRIHATDVPQRLGSELRQIESVKEVEVTITDPGSNHADIIVHTTSAEDTLPQLTEIMVKAGVRIRLIEQAKPSLEDVFISLTGRRLTD